jgi:signal transduction histidine kinase
MGVPADLLARWARCGLLAELKRDAELRGAAAELARHLIDGRWAIDRTTFDLHLGDAAGWLHPDGVPSIPASRLALANVVERLWNSRGHRASSGRETAVIDATRITALWRRGPEGVVALVAGPSYAERHWLDGLVPQMERHQIRVSLYDPGDRQRGTNESRRSALDTGLPWQVVVEDTDLEEQLAALGTRRRWWLTGLAVFGVFIFAGTWMIGSAVARELAVARLQSDFVAAVSHEFRTPLTSMRQLTEILVDERIASDDRRRSYYQALARQTDRLQRLVESLLDFGRMEAGRSPYRLEPLDLAALVRSVVDQFEAEVSGRGYHVELAIDGPTSTIAGDREALTHALWNLLDNAVKYSAETRTVWVRVEPAGDRLAVRVRDRGIGIPTGEQRAIFQKFVRGAAARAENIAGTGIGLAMVHHVVSAHGGEVQVESEPGSGSTFTILLPTLAPSAVRATTLQAVRD